MMSITSLPPRPLLCVSIDCERDKGPGWRIQRPASYVGVHDGIARKLHPLFRRFGVKPTYLLSAEVIRDPASAERLTRLPGSFELGTHLHAEYVAPGADDHAESTLFQAALPPEFANDYCCIDVVAVNRENPQCGQFSVRNRKSYDIGFLISYGECDGVRPYDCLSLWVGPRNLHYIFAWRELEKFSDLNVVCKSLAGSLTFLILPKLAATSGDLKTA